MTSNIQFDTIILLDDNDTSIFLNSDVVSDYFPDAQIITYSNSSLFVKDALKNLQWFREPTLLLLDINMPNFMGYEVLDELEDELEDLAHMVVLMVTSSNLKRDIERSTRFSSIIGYIEKPLSAEKFEHVFNHSIDRSL